MSAVDLQSICRGAKGAVKTLIRQAVAEGWAVSLTRGSHLRLEHPRASRPVFGALTPGCQMATKKLRGDMRRALGQ